MDNNDLAEVVNHGGVNFKDKLAELKAKGAKIHPLVWDIMYLYLADYLSVINLVCGFYIKKNMSISVNDGKKIQSHNRKASHIIDVIINPDKIQENEIELLKIKEEASKLGPDLRNFLGHYVRNRLHNMGFILDDSIDPIDPNPVSIERAKKIYDDSSQIISILEGMRKELQGIDRVQV